MSKIVLEITVSLDGFICEAGDDLERIHSWLFSEKTEADLKVLDESRRSLGAVIMGRRTFEDGVKKQGWSGWVDNPPFDVPMFVLSHDVPEKLARGKTAFTFIEGIENVLHEAKTVAGEKTVSIMGGANIAQQFLKAGLLDEMQLHLVPVMLINGTKLFEHLGKQKIELEPIKVVESATVTHLHYRLIKENDHA